MLKYYNITSLYVCQNFNLAKKKIWSEFYFVVEKFLYIFLSLGENTYFLC